MRNSKEHCGGLIWSDLVWSDDESEYSQLLWTTQFSLEIIVFTSTEN